MNKEIKIAVTGGAGLTGQCAVRDLLRNKKIKQILVADYDSLGLELLQRTLQHEIRNEPDRLAFEKVNVTKHEDASRILQGYDVVVNAVQYYFNLDVMSAALNAGANYLDFGGLYHTTLKQIEAFHEKFRSAGLLAVVGMGAQPGVTNLMIKHSLQSMDHAQSVEIFDGWTDMTKTESPMYFTWSPQTFFDESSQEAVVFEDGRYVTRPAFSEPEKVKFPQPVGEVNVYLSLHSEIATIPKSFEKYGLKKVVWKEGSSDFWKIKFLADLGLTSKEEIPFEGRNVVPRKFLLRLLESRHLIKVPEGVIPNDLEITRVVVKGSREKKKRNVIVDCFFPSYKPWKVSCSQYNVGIPGSIAAQKIALDDTRPKGVLPPEQVFDPLEFFDELEKRGIRIRKRIASK